MAIYTKDIYFSYLFTPICTKFDAPLAAGGHPVVLDKDTLDVLGVALHHVHLDSALAIPGPAGGGCFELTLFSFSVETRLLI